MNQKDKKVIEDHKKNTLIIFDTNVWIDLYKLNPLLIEAFIKGLEKISYLFWIPEQIYIEFNKNISRSRHTALSKFTTLKEELLEKLNRVETAIKNDLSNVQHTKKISNLQDEINLDFKKIRKKIKKEIEDYNSIYKNESIIISKESDIIENFFSKLYDSKRNKFFSTSELIKIYEIGETRFKYKIPPGYTDNSKDGIEKFGDLIIWKEILKEVKDKEINLIFVQNERKSDWWDKKENNHIPKILINEFKEVTTG